MTRDPLVKINPGSDPEQKRQNSRPPLVVVVPQGQGKISTVSVTTVTENRLICVLWSPINSFAFESAVAIWAIGIKPKTNITETV